MEDITTKKQLICSGKNGRYRTGMVAVVLLDVQMEMLNFDVFVLIPGMFHHFPMEFLG